MATLRNFRDQIAASDVTDDDIIRLQLGVLYSRGSLNKADRKEVSRILGVLRSILANARKDTPND